jgi:hypothetical protein
MAFPGPFRRNQAGPSLGDREGLHGLADPQSARTEREMKCLEGALHGYLVVQRTRQECAPTWTRPRGVTTGKTGQFQPPSRPISATQHLQ